MKMFLLSKKYYAGGEITLEFVQPIEDTEENKAQRKEIASSNLILTLGRESKDDFDLGSEYYIDFRKKELEG